MLNHAPSSEDVSIWLHLPAALRLRILNRAGPVWILHCSEVEGFISGDVVALWTARLSGQAAAITLNVVMIPIDPVRMMLASGLVSGVKMGGAVAGVPGSEGFAFSLEGFGFDDDENAVTLGESEGSSGLSAALYMLSERVGKMRAPWSENDQK